VTAPPASPHRWRGGPLRRPATRFPGGVDGPRREARTRECGRESFWSAQVDRRPEAFVPIEIGLQRRCAPGVGLRRRGACFFGRRRPTVGRRPPEAEFIRRAGRRPKAFAPIEIGLLRRSRARRRPPPTQKTPSRSAQVDRRPEAPGGRIHSACRPTAEGSVPIEIGLQRRCAPGVGLRRRKRHLPGRRRPTVGRRPLEAEFIRRAGRRPKAPCRLKSAFKGAARRASAFADAKDTFPVGAGRPSTGGHRRPNSFGAQADWWPEAFVPIEIGLRRRCAPGVGLRRCGARFFGRRRPTVGRRPPEAEFIRRAGRPLAEGFCAD